MPRAGQSIPFVPAQLELYPGDMGQPEQVIVARQINIHLDPNEIGQQFIFFPKMENGKISEKYRAYIYDRVTQVLLGLGGESQQGQMLSAIINNADESKIDEPVLRLAREIKDFTDAFGEYKSLTKRYFASFTRVNDANSESLIDKFQTKIEKVKANLTKQKDTAAAEQKISTTQ